MPGRSIPTAVPGPPPGALLAWLPAPNKLPEPVVDGSQGVKPAEFGAVGDFNSATGTGTDDTEALQACFDWAMVHRVPVLITGNYKISSELAGNSYLHLIGVGGSICVTQRDARRRRCAIIVRTQEAVDNPGHVFHQDITIDGVRFWSRHQNVSSVKIYNGRNIRFINNNCENIGGLFVSTARRVDRFSAGESGDPAVEAGFSPDNFDDLSSGIEFHRNHIDGKSYYVQGLRFNYTKNVSASHNVLKFSNISWWGGGAKRGQGGERKFLRRVRHVNIFSNYISWSNGAVYGNNGQHIFVDRNFAEYIIDTAFDMEGCLDFVVSNNYAQYVGNFCYSVFYQCRGVFSNNVGRQDPMKSSLLNKAAETKRYGPSRGSVFFQQISGFDDGPEPPSRVEVSGNRWIFESPEGFGYSVLHKHVELIYENNLHINVGIRFGSYQRSRMRANNFSFSNPAPDNFVYIRVGMSEADIYQNIINITSGNSSSTAILVRVHEYRGGNVLRITDNKIMADELSASVLVADTRDRKGRGPSQIFEIFGNLLSHGLADVSTNVDPENPTASVIEVKQGRNLDQDMQRIDLHRTIDRDRFGGLGQ